ncbi:formate/nitrite transporter family protein [Flammeovirga pectinis]|uniref:Formate/nitrite transporter family protein n=1 Tax=Flammeovirga pectinis TaxID=2494373 RepID=A0A3Q9FQN2_9BACT|nr:formate/nitrite transporter family protein [Flammeovirga pectinis]AZQ62499.1 formate/nitrite transporter family protein [Flammeovirga pectinis]
MSYSSPKDILGNIRNGALQKGKMSIQQLLVFGFLGGAYVAFGFLLAIVVGGGMPGIGAENPGIPKFVMGAVFPVGLILCIIAGAELFTSSTAMMTVSVLSKDQSIKKLGKVWTFGYLGNFVGSLFVAYFITTLTGVVDGEVFHNSLISVAEHKVGNPFYKTFFKAVGANWLVCLAAWQAYAAKDVMGKVIGIWFPVMTFVTFGFEHCIANMYVIPAAIFNGADITWTDFIITNLIPATIGNIVGGAFFVGTIYWWMFVKPEQEEEKKQLDKELESININS